MHLAGLREVALEVRGVDLNLRDITGVSPGWMKVGSRVHKRCFKKHVDGWRIVVDMWYAGTVTGCEVATQEGQRTHEKYGK